MAITNEELSKQIQDLIPFVDARIEENADLILGSLRDNIRGAEVTMPVNANDALKVFAVVTVATVAGHAVWKGGEWLYKKYQENQKKNNGGS